jgi:hypothetical protein
MGVFRFAQVAVTSGPPGNGTGSDQGKRLYSGGKSFGMGEFLLLE